jgi:N-methylhydantoinase A/oxoprolinase/acetone carboxylase beta subunit
LSTDGISAAFDAIYFRRYGRRLARTPVLVNVHTTVVGERPHLDFGSLVKQQAHSRSNGRPVVESRRPVWFEEVGFVETDVFLRKDFEPGDSIDGPAIVEQDDSTTVIEPGMVAVADQHGNLIVRLGMSKQ